MTAARAGSVVLALLVALAAGPGVEGCGKYGRPVRSAPRQAQDLGAAERGAAGGFESERPEEDPVEENGGEESEREQPEQGEAP